MADNDGPVSAATAQPAPADKPCRASIADLFRPSDSLSASAPRSAALPSAMAQVQQQQNNHVRRLSITTLGLSGATAQSAQPSPFSAIRDRGRSIGDNQPRPPSLYEGNESAIAEDGDAVPPMNNGSSPGATGSLGRRLSAGAKAYSEIRRGSNGSAAAMAFAGVGGSPRAAGSPPTAKQREGYNWSDSLRDRAERSSISAGAGNPTMGHARVPSQTAAAAPPAPRPVPQQQPPAPRPAQQQKPDAFQERILKGDFYMD